MRTAERISLGRGNAIFSYSLNEPSSLSTWGSNVLFMSKLGHCIITWRRPKERFLEEGWHVRKSCRTASTGPRNPTHCLSCELEDLCSGVCEKRTSWSNLWPVPTNSIILWPSSRTHEEGKGEANATRIDVRCGDRNDRCHSLSCSLRCCSSEFGCLYHSPRLHSDIAQIWRVVKIFTLAHGWRQDDKQQ